MNILYKGKYKRRFKDVFSLLLGSTSVVELCFGDIYLAGYCKKSNINWLGYDVSDYFVKRAKKKGYNALKSEVLTLNNIPKADACIMIGSLYHFEGKIPQTLKKMFSVSNKLIISEPVKNLSNSNGLLRMLANRMTKANKGEEQFRFTKKTLLKTLDNNAKILQFSYKVIKENRDILIEINHD